MTGTNWFIKFEDWYGERFEMKPEHEPHSGRVEKIVIGHMVSAPFLPAAKKLKCYGQDIVYNMCFGLDQKCYEGRPLDIKPALLKGHNEKACAVGLIANTCEDSRCVIGEELVTAWARMFAHIALRLGLGELIWGINIVGQHDIDPEKYPVSPGPKFYQYRDEIIRRANEFIANPINYASGNLLD